MRPLYITHSNRKAEGQKGNVPGVWWCAANGETGDDWAACVAGCWSSWAGGARRLLPDGAGPHACSEGSPMLGDVE